MSEKTAEEKLREELEGMLAESSQSSETAQSRPVKKPVNMSESRSVHSKAKSKGLDMPKSVGQRVDSFMEDLNLCIRLNTIAI